MDTTTDSSTSVPELTRILTGDLPLVVVLAAILSAVVSWILLRIYRRSVLRSMAQTATQGAVRPPSLPLERESLPPVSPLNLRWLQASSEIDLPAGPEPAWRQVHESVRSATLVQTAAGVAYALVITAAWMFAAKMDFSIVRFLWVAGCYVWLPAMATLSVVAVERAYRLKISIAYFAFMAALAWWIRLRNPDVPLWQMAFVWCFANVPSGLLLFIFLNRIVRAAGPLVLTLSTAALSGVVLAMEAAIASASLKTFLAKVGTAFGFGAATVVSLLGAVGFAMLALLAWPVLRWIGRHYLAKRTSDQQLTLDTVWLLIAAFQSFTFAFVGLAWTLTGIVAFAAYKAVGAAGRRWALRKTRFGEPPPEMLLLRVFSLGKRSEALFDFLNRRWLRAGTIAMLSGPDLATISVEPHEFLAFLGGKLSRQFVKDRQDLESRVASMDRERDPDGRYRVSEFFCHADTWQMAVQRLARDAQVVVMDLRSFSPANHGCIYEVRQLLFQVPLARIVFIVDATTDRGFLEETLKRLWAEIPVASPNRAVFPAALRLLRLRAGTATDFSLLLRAMFSACR